jgi:hypothetical protein
MIAPKKITVRQGLPLDPVAPRVIFSGPIGRLLPKYSNKYIALQKYEVAWYRPRLSSNRYRTNVGGE